MTTKETKAELVDKLILYVRTDNYNAFFSACNRGMNSYGTKQFADMMHYDFIFKLFSCEAVDTFIKWGEKLNNGTI
tara:strand:+ start:94 stop:321 length:228 start_codon:yes stop_codon:yes gene_type:complete